VLYDEQLRLPIILHQPGGTRRADAFRGQYAALVARRRRQFGSVAWNQRARIESLSCDEPPMGPELSRARPRPPPPAS
jgi:hypothetical protein